LRCLALHQSHDAVSFVRLHAQWPQQIHSDLHRRLVEADMVPQITGFGFIQALKGIEGDTTSCQDMLPKTN
jgi:hypothetical protein